MLEKLNLPGRLQDFPGLQGGCTDLDESFMLGKE